MWMETTAVRSRGMAGQIAAGRATIAAPAASPATNSRRVSMSSCPSRERQLGFFDPPAVHLCCGAERQNYTGHVAFFEPLRVGDDQFGTHLRVIVCDAQDVAFALRAVLARHETHPRQTVRRAGEIGIHLACREIEPAVAIVPASAQIARFPL